MNKEVTTSVDGEQETLTDIRSGFKFTHTYDPMALAGVGLYISLKDMKAEGEQIGIGLRRRDDYATASAVSLALAYQRDRIPNQVGTNNRSIDALSAVAVLLLKKQGNEIKNMGFVNAVDYYEKHGPLAFYESGEHEQYNDLIMRLEESLYKRPEMLVLDIQKILQQQESGLTTVISAAELEVLARDRYLIKGPDRQQRTVIATAGLSGSSYAAGFWQDNNGKTFKAEYEGQMVSVLNDNRSCYWKDFEHAAALAQRAGGGVVKINQEQWDVAIKTQLWSAVVAVVKEDWKLFERILADVRGSPQAERIEVDKSSNLVIFDYSEPVGRIIGEQGTNIKKFQDLARTFGWKIRVTNQARKKKEAGRQEERERKGLEKERLRKQTREELVVIIAKDKLNALQAAGGDYKELSDGLDHTKSDDRELILWLYGEMKTKQAEKKGK